jgi:hypothetical protein
MFLQAPPAVFVAQQRSFLSVSSLRERSGNVSPLGRHHFFVYSFSMAGDF